MMEPTGITMTSFSIEANESEFKELSARLYAYIKKMRELRNGAPQLDSHNFFKSVDSMEREMVNLKTLYEKEIMRLRQQCEEMNRQRYQLELQNNKLEVSASELQSQFAAETQKSNSLSVELTTLQKEYYAKEEEYQKSMREVVASASGQMEVNAANRKLDQTLRENMDLHRRYEAELLLRQEHEEKVQQLQEQINFNLNVNKQQQQDLQERLAAANSAILSLESKVRVLNRPDSETNVGEMLANIKAAAERDIQRYKEEAEAMFAKNVSMLQAQMAADKRAIESLTEENRQLQTNVEDLRVQARNLQGEVTHVLQMKRNAEDSINSERERSSKHIRVMENKLKEIQDMLFEKMKELNLVKVEALPLKAEVESLRALIAEEERRLDMELSKLPPISSPTKFPESTFNFQASNLAQTYKSGVTEASVGARTDAVTRTVQVEPAARLDTLAFDTTKYQSFSTEAGHTLTSAAKPIGPVRSKSAQFQSGDEGSLSVPRTRTNTQILNLQDPGAEDMTEPEGPESVSQSKPSAVVSHDYNQHSSSATGDIRIHEVKPDGKSICLVNMSNDKDIDFSGYALKQQVGGCPVALYRFPPKTMFAAKSYITVYSGCNDVILHQPPTQFVWREQDRWGTGPECTTILCKPNGQAVAWMTAAHRFGDISMETKNVDGLSSDLPTFTRNLNAPQQEMLLLKRQKESPPSLAPPKQPHGNAYCQVHSSYNEKRVKDLGNDNSSNHRQARCQAMAVPDKVPGEPYAGIKGQTMGSSTMRRYTPLNPRSGNVRMNGSITNRVDGNIRFGSVSPFNSPQQQEFSRALENKSTLLTTSVQFV